MMVDIIILLWVLLLTGFVLKSMFSLEKRITFLETYVKDIEFDVSKSTETFNNLTGLLENDKKHLNFIEMSRMNQYIPNPVMNQQSSNNGSLDTGGDLIQANLTKEELETLNLFYEKENRQS